MSLFDKEALRSLIHDTKSDLLAEGKSENVAERLTRKEFQKWLGEYSDSLKEIIHSNTTLDPKEKDARIKRQFVDFDYFRRTYFPHYYYLPGKSALQADLETIYQRIKSRSILSSAAANALDAIKSEKYGVAAPRGHGKSTDVSVVFVIWCIVNNLKHFITIFSDAIELAETQIEAIKVELSENDNLKADFPHATGISKRWKIGDFVTKNGVRVKGYGSSKRVRGIKHGVWRVDLAIGDDLENDENVRNRDQRDKQEAWFDDAVANLGAVNDNMDIIYIGTLLHKDSVLARKLKLAYWNPRIHKAIITFPERMDLWERFTTLHKNQGLDASHAFYLANKQDMDKGARVLWGEAVSLETLMRKRAEAPRSFNKEYQNEPSSGFEKFMREKMHFYKHDPSIRQLKIYGWCDPAGMKKKSDYTNLTIFGVDEKERKGYVLESINEVIGSKEICKRMVDLQAIYKCKYFGYEDNGGQFHLKPFILDEAFDRGIAMPLRGINNTDNKELRIEELEIPIENGEIILHEDQIQLIQQLEDFPEGTHDDAPDGLVCVYRLSKLAKMKKHNSAPRTNRRALRERHITRRSYQ